VVRGWRGSQYCRQAPTTFSSSSCEADRDEERVAVKVDEETLIMGPVDRML